MKLNEQLIKRAVASKRRLRKFPKMLHPVSVERTYRKRLYAFCDAFAKVIRRELIAKLPTLADEIYSGRPELARKDAGEDRIGTIIRNIKVSFAEEYSEAEIAAMARAQGISVSQFNRQLIADGIKKVIGVDLFLSEPWLAQEIEFFTIANTNLITTLRDNALSRVQTEVYEAFRAGTRWEELASKLEEYVDPDVKGGMIAKAEQIARDQTAKLNGQLTELRQTELGIDRYIWRTSLDERVRDSHRAKEGKVFRWDDPPADTGHPGEDFNCRCTAEPYLEGLLQSATFRSNAPVFPGENT